LRELFNTGAALVNIIDKAAQVILCAHLIIKSDDRQAAALVMLLQTMLNSAFDTPARKILILLPPPLAPIKRRCFEGMR
jgi:hypothetical protein